MYEINGAERVNEVVDEERLWEDVGSLRKKNEEERRRLHKVSRRKMRRLVFFAFSPD